MDLYLHQLGFSGKRKEEKNKFHEKLLMLPSIYNALALILHTKDQSKTTAPKQAPKPWACYQALQKAKHLKCINEVQVFLSPTLEANMSLLFFETE